MDENVKKTLHELLKAIRAFVPQQFRQEVTVVREDIIPNSWDESPPPPPPQTPITAAIELSAILVPQVVPTSTNFNDSTPSVLQSSLDVISQKLDKVIEITSTSLSCHKIAEEKIEKNEANVLQIINGQRHISSELISVNAEVNRFRVIGQRMFMNAAAACIVVMVFFASGIYLTSIPGTMAQKEQGSPANISKPVQKHAAANLNEGKSTQDIQVLKKNVQSLKIELANAIKRNKALVTSAKINDQKILAVTNSCSEINDDPFHTLIATVYREALQGNICQNPQALNQISRFIQERQRIKSDRVCVRAWHEIESISKRCRTPRYADHQLQDRRGG